MLATGIAGVLAAACAPAPKEISFATPSKLRGATCDTATANVVTFGRSNAKLYSEVSIRHQISDLKGYMFTSGLRRLRVVQQNSSCTAAGKDNAPSNLYQCTARAQVCGQ
jgi:hypothetical protein